MQRLRRSEVSGKAFYCEKKEILGKQVWMLEEQNLKKLQRFIMSRRLENEIFKIPTTAVLSHRMSMDSPRPSVSPNIGSCDSSWTADKGELVSRPLQPPGRSHCSLEVVADMERMTGLKCLEENLFQRDH